MTPAEAIVTKESAAAPPKPQTPKEEIKEEETKKAPEGSLSFKRRFTLEVEAMIAKSFSRMKDV